MPGAARGNLPLVQTALAGFLGVAVLLGAADRPPAAAPAGASAASGAVGVRGPLRVGRDGWAALVALAAG